MIYNRFLGTILSEETAFMPGSVIAINIGFIKINNMAGSANFVVGDAFSPGIESQTKNYTAGPFNTGDGNPMINPNTPFFNDPDIIDNSSPKQFTGT
jgi:hypothetical protein